MRFQRSSRLGGLLALALAGVVAWAQTVVLTPNTTVLSGAGGNVTFTASIAYTTTPSTLGFTVTLPTGWMYLGSTSVAGTNPPEPSITPVVGRVGALDWAFVNPPANGSTFTFTTSYPAGTLGTQLLTTSLVARDGSGGTPATVTGPAVTLSPPSNLLVWAGGTGAWTDAAQWSPATVPQNAAGQTYSATVAAGVATLGSSLTIDNLTFTGGTITGAGNLTLAALGSSWTAGVFSGVGELIIAPDAQLIASGNAAHSFSERTIRNQGTFVWVDRGALLSGSGGQFINSAGATFLDATTGVVDYVIANNTGGTFTFSNAGTFLKSTPSSTRVSVPFTNTGNLLVVAGSLRFSDAFTQTGGIVHVGTGATLRVDNGLAFAGGLLHGGGTVVANITNGAVLSPGDPVGTLTVQGDLTLLGTSQLLFDLRAPVQGTGYDFLNVTGAVALGGSLTFNMLAGSETAFSSTDTLTLLSGTSLTGTFAGVPDGTRLFASQGTGSFVINYTGNSVVLNQFLPIPEPSTWTLMVTGLAVVAVTTIRRRRRDAALPAAGARGGASAETRGRG